MSLQSCDIGPGSTSTGKVHFNFTEICGFVSFVSVNRRQLLQALSVEASDTQSTAEAVPRQGAELNAAGVVNISATFIDAIHDGDAVVVSVQEGRLLKELLHLDTRRNTVSTRQLTGFMLTD